MTESRKTTIIVVAAVAALLALYSGWRAFGGSAPATDRNNSNAGPISSMSSMLGPNASGKPQTQVPGGGPPPSTRSQDGASQANQMGRMMGRPGGGAPSGQTPGGQ